MSYKRTEKEFWTNKQRQACSIHEVSYRACFKPQLPKYFIDKYTKEGELVYDPFGGRGTTAIEAALLGRNFITNDINPLSTLFVIGRLNPPSIEEIHDRLYSEINSDTEVDKIDLSMFYEYETFKEINDLRNYFIKKKLNSYDNIDHWIKMVATNRLTGHSKGFFSVYTLPPNQATSAKRQIQINLKRNQTPEYKDTKEIIVKKSKQLLRNISDQQIKNLDKVRSSSLILQTDATKTKQIPSNSVKLTITSPPFLDIVNYAQDNWLRCWFNDIDLENLAKKITMSKNIEDWSAKMSGVFKELNRVSKAKGVVAFEVGEIRNGKIKLEDHIIPVAENNGFKVKEIMINKQNFTKTSNIWGVSNNQGGTNTNRIVLLEKVNNL
ncbi:MAG: DNA methyltransferase [Gammaproteobacteria bacterium]|jgi:DNA modification methylase|nr:MAG: site-specific DNA-methyltransferase [Gammaproteobacteria bacterium TMED225]|tara:strand:+ start:862 stop:2004 length:1143 start_codon:yes stop_codon:yes gene_type:complete